MLPKKMTSAWWEAGNDKKSADIFKRNYASEATVAVSAAGAEAVGSIPSGRATTPGGRHMNKTSILKAALVLLGAGVMACAALLYIGSAHDEENESLYRGYVAAAEQKSSDIQIKQTDAPVTIDWESLLAVNDEVAGWVYADADDAKDIISYPVLYRAGDRDFYLRHDIRGGASQYGVPYIPGDYDLNTCKAFSIHGHNFGSDAQTMFSPLVKYEDQEYESRHPVIWYGKVGGEVQPYRIFSVVRYDCTALDEGLPCWNYLQNGFSSDDEYEAWLQEAKAESLFETWVDAPTADDEVIILSTCQKAKRTSERCVVFAVKEADVN